MCFLSNFCELGQLKLFSSDSDPFLILSANNLPPRLNYFVHLATTNKKILMINFQSPGNIKIRRYCFDRQDWLRMNLTEDAVFMGDRKSTGVHKRTLLRGCPDSVNYIYYLVTSRNTSALCYIDGRVRKRFSTIHDDGQPNIPLDVPIWYFPHLSYYDGFQCRSEVVARVMVVGIGMVYSALFLKVGSQCLLESCLSGMR